MMSLRIESTAEPFTSHPELADAAFTLLFRSQFVGAIPDVDRHVLDLGLVTAIGESLGQGRTSPAALELKSSGNRFEGRGVSREQVQNLLRALRRLQTEVEESPRPQGEWAPVTEALGEDLVAELVGTSSTSLRRYRAGDRVTPQDVAERLHFTALVLGELAGSYNDYGMRRWFTRPRAALDGQAPADLMGKGFDPDGSEGARIRSVAESLRAA